MNILLLMAHSIAEYDDVRMFSDLGYDVFAIGAYSEPANPGSGLRPPLPGAPDHPELRALVIEQREKHAGEDESWAIDWAKADLHPDLVDWADVIICHHYLDRWIIPQWPKLKHKRVIWRTCGQSDPRLEGLMAPLHRDGLQIVRYSPAEERTFRTITNWAGQDALIRFGKYPDDFEEWTGVVEAVGNVTQNMIGRGDHCGLSFWLAATRDLPAMPAGTGSEKLPGGVGELSPQAMMDYLRHLRVYLYTGTVPASYTLALIEAMMAGVPVVAMSPSFWLGPPSLFEAPDIVGGYLGDIASTARMLKAILADEGYAEEISRDMRRRAIELFNVADVGPQWRDFLGYPGAPRQLAMGRARA